MSKRDIFYNKCLCELNELIPPDEKRKILSQRDCELEEEFMGFIDEYKPLSETIPKDKIIIDFGCYLAAQSYFFKDHAKYIGVDVIQDMIRFSPPNAEHYTCSIQHFIKFHADELFKQYGNDTFFAICSYVPDFAATDLVKKVFQNSYVYYPGGEETYHGKI